MEPPRDEDELQSRLARLAGLPLGAIAAAHGIAPPADERRSKGWVGQLFERALGATAASRAEPDFPELGIELKTVPVDSRGRPLESSFVASLELGEFDRRWDTSAVRAKLQHVAWVTVEAAKGLALADRRCGPSLLWRPSAAQEAALRGDYEEIVELYADGFGARVTGHLGEALQLRPKGRDAKDLRFCVDEEGARARTAPRAFYLRRGFTAGLLGGRFE